MTKRIRVLHVLLNLNYGGLERLLMDLVSGLDQARFEPHVLAVDYLGRFSEGLESHARVHLAPRMSRLSLIHPHALIRTIQNIAPDVVHTHSGVWYKGSLAARRAGVPRIIHTDHGRRFLVERRLDLFLERRAARRTDVIVAVSDPLGKRLAAFFPLEARRICVIRNGVNTDRFRPHRSPAEPINLSLPASTPVIGSIGRLEPIKAYDVMIEAMAVLLSHWRGGGRPALVIAGDGSERGRLESLVKARGLQNDVRFLGWRDDVRRLHASFSIFTMSSHSEGTSISLLEAMSAGLCPVVTDVGGNAAVLGPDLRQRLVPPADPAQLARAWNVALTQIADRTRDAEIARDRVQEAYGVRTMVRAYEELYCGGLSTPRSS